MLYTMTSERDRTGGAGPPLRHREQPGRSKTVLAQQHTAQTTWFGNLEGRTGNRMGTAGAWIAGRGWAAGVRRWGGFCRRWSFEDGGNLIALPCGGAGWSALRSKGECNAILPENPSRHSRSRDRRARVRGDDRDSLRHRVRRRREAASGRLGDTRECGAPGIARRDDE